MSTILDKKKPTQSRGERDVRLGTVISDKGDKTIRVRYDFMVKHDKYGKYYRRSTILAAHDEKNEAKATDVVEVVSCRACSAGRCAEALSTRACCSLTRAWPPRSL